MKRLQFFFIVAISALWVSGCGESSGHHDEDHHDHANHEDHDHGTPKKAGGHEECGGCEGHAHAAPHGGTLLVFGHEFAHLELVLNPKTGEMKAYVLDGEAKNGLRISQPTLTLNIKKNGAPVQVNMTAEANALSGETVGNSSVFSVSDDRLMRMSQFEATVENLDIKGSKFDGTQFHFPEGNH